MLSNWGRKGYNKYKGVCPVITITVLGKGEPYDSVFNPFPVYVECTFRFCSFPYLAVSVFYLNEGTSLPISRDHCKRAKNPPTSFPVEKSKFGVTCETGQ